MENNSFFGTVFRSLRYDVLTRGERVLTPRMGLPVAGFWDGTFPRGLDHEVFVCLHPPLVVLRGIFSPKKFICTKRLDREKTGGVLIF
jgi:hypothetical protein